MVYIMYLTYNSWGSFEISLIFMENRESSRIE